MHVDDLHMLVGRGLTIYIVTMHALHGRSKKEMEVINIC